MSKKKKFNIQDVLPISKNFITRYSKDAWLKCYPESSEEEWEERQTPDSLYDYIDLQEYLLDKEFENPIKIVTLDEEYFDWLGNKENNYKSRLEYAYLVSDEDAYRLLKKNNFDKEEMIRLMPVIIIKDNSISSDVSKLELPDDYRQLIENNYKKSLECDVCVSPFLIDASFFYDIDKDLEDYLLEDLEDYEANVLKYNRWALNVKNINSNLIFACIPVIIHSRHKSAIFDYDSYETACAVEPETKLIEDFEEGFELKVINYDFSIAPNLLAFDEVEEYFSDLFNRLKKEQKSHNNNRKKQKK